jgi:formylglycine-generating enzyme required for sulfatase activity
MGSNNGQSDEKPIHLVTIGKSFYMSQCEVTQAQYQAVIGSNPSYLKDPNRPVETLTWSEAVAFCNALSSKSGKTVRLPSEAEWEYACKASSGSSDNKYCFGNDDSQLTTYAVYNVSSTGFVGKKTSNSFGMYDMHGNVWEYCQDIWHDDYTDAPADGSAWTVGSSSSHIIRGGSFYNEATYCRSANRDYFSASTKNPDTGFRVVVNE